jgi:ribosomal protein S18 acetylase RimI-like enzyme
MTEFHQAQAPEDLNQVNELFTEYMTWVYLRLNEEHGIDIDVQSKVAQDLTELHMFAPPSGRLALVMHGSELVGMGCLKSIGDELGEIKRMYVRPQFRGRGIGRELLEHLVQQAKTIGFRHLRLDSTKFMDIALSLYRSFGFEEIEPYPESEIPEELHEHWVFMEKDLAGMC